MKKMGIMGGTFDPIHNGHIMLGLCAHEEYGLDQVYYMPSGQPPHKQGKRVTEASMRAEMVRLAIEPYPQFVFSDFEIKREGNTYTAQTLALLNQYHPDTQYYFIIGADSLFQILNWYHPEEIFQRAVLLAAARDHTSDSQLNERIAFLREHCGADIRLLHSPNIDVSSEELRRRIGRGQSVEGYLDSRVEAYIHRHRLYLIDETPEDRKDGNQNVDGN